MAVTVLVIDGDVSLLTAFAQPGVVAVIDYVDCLDGTHWMQSCTRDEITPEARGVLNAVRLEGIQPDSNKPQSRYQFNRPQ